MSKTLTMFGLSHCSTCQKAQAALEEHGWTVSFRDVQKEPLSEAERQALVSDFGDKIINRASLTWRGMSDEERTADPVHSLPWPPSPRSRFRAVFPHCSAPTARSIGCRCGNRR
jgi:arsenate reductase